MDRRGDSSPFQKSMLIFFTGMILSGCKPLSAQGSDFHKDIHEYTDKIFDSLVNIRRDIHRHPELSGEEVRTSEIIKKNLASLGLKFQSNIGGCGVLAILEGNKPGPCVAWRADMDAFADESPDVVDFPSEIRAVRHICGHDIHTVIGLGIAKVLSANKDRINGTIMFIFQPSEENFKGAKSMIDDEIFTAIKPDIILALHLAPLPVGVVATKSNEMFAHRIELSVKLKEIRNEESIVNEVSELLQGINKPEAQNIFNVPIGDQEVGLFSPDSILKDYFQVSNIKAKREEEPETVIFRAKAYSSSLSNINNAIAKLHNLFNDSLLCNNLETMTYSYDQPVVFNDSIVATRSINILKSIYGGQSILPLYGIMPNFNDDFAYFMEETKGVYFFLGGSNFSEGIVSMPHSPDFAVDENCIKTGVNYFSSLIYELLK